MSDIIGGPCPNCGQQGVFNCCSGLHHGSPTDASTLSLLPKSQASEVPVVSVPVAEWSQTIRRIGYLEGVIETLTEYTDDPQPMLERAMERYKKICGEL